MSAHPLRYANGEIFLKVTDLQAGGFGRPWGHTRSWANQMSAEYDGPNGYNWFCSDFLHLVQPAPGTLVVMGDANETLWFDEQDGQYQARFGVCAALVLDGGQQLYRLTLPDGTVMEFPDFVQSVYPQGLLRKTVSPGGAVTEVVSYYGGEIQEIQRCYVADGVKHGESFLYTYDTDGSYLGRLIQVLLRRKSAAESQWEQAAWEDVSKVEYTYEEYFDGIYESWGLKSATTYTKTVDSWDTTGRTYYRYELLWLGDHNHWALRYVLNPASYAAPGGGHGSRTGQRRVAGRVRRPLLRLRLGRPGRHGGGERREADLPVRLRDQCQRGRVQQLEIPDRRGTAQRCADGGVLQLCGTGHAEGSTRGESRGRGTFLIQLVRRGAAVRSLVDVRPVRQPGAGDPPGEPIGRDRLRRPVRGPAARGRRRVRVPQGRRRADPAVRV